MIYRMLSGDWENIKKHFSRQGRKRRKKEEA
jgi:hypothetical protein